MLTRVMVAANTYQGCFTVVLDSNDVFIHGSSSTGANIYTCNGYVPITGSSITGLLFTTAGGTNTFDSSASLHVRYS